MDTGNQIPPHLPYLHRSPAHRTRLRQAGLRAGRLYKKRGITPLWPPAHRTSAPEGKWFGMLTILSLSKEGGEEGFKEVIFRTICLLNYRLPIIILYQSMSCF